MVVKPENITVVSNYTADGRFAPIITWTMPSTDPNSHFRIMLSDNNGAYYTHPSTVYYPYDTTRAEDVFDVSRDALINNNPFLVIISNLEGTDPEDPAAMGEFEYSPRFVAGPPPTPPTPPTPRPTPPTFSGGSFRKVDHDTGRHILSDNLEEREGIVDEYIVHRARPLRPKRKPGERDKK